MRELTLNGKALTGSTKRRQMISLVHAGLRMPTLSQRSAADPKSVGCEGQPACRRFVANKLRALLPSRVCDEEGAEVGGQGLRLVDGDEGSAVVDPHEVCVLEVVGESLGVGGGHELVVSCPDDLGGTPTGPAKVRCWSAHLSSCWGLETLRR